jgi:hypothetical protein
MRVVDVKDERNKLTRDFLEEAKNVAGGVAAIIPNPAILPGIGIAFKAAQLVLANQNNEVLLDYSVQFYSADTQAAANGAGLGALRRGAFLVVGRPNADSNFWSKTLVFDKARGQIFADSTPAPTPFMVTTIATAESIVPKIVIERSAALQKIFTDTIRYNVEQADKEASALKASVDTLVATERVFRYRDMDSVNRISRLLQDAVPTLPEDAAPNRSPNSPSANSLSAEDIYTLVSMMSRISGKSFSSSQQAIDWWTKKGKNGQFDRKKFLIITD